MVLQLLIELLVFITQYQSYIQSLQMRTTSKKLKISIHYSIIIATSTDLFQFQQEVIQKLTPLVAYSSLKEEGVSVKDSITYS